MRIDFLHAGPQLTEAVLADAERRLGVTLPPQYRSFLLKHNGGRPVPNGFSIQGMRRNSIGEVDYFYAISGERRGADLENAMRVAKSSIPGDCIPIAATTDGDQLLLAISGLHAGHVYLWDSRGARHDPESRIYFLANDFDEFLESLHEVADDEELTEESEERIATSGEADDSSLDDATPRICTTAVCPGCEHAWNGLFLRHDGVVACPGCRGEWLLADWAADAEIAKPTGQKLETDDPCPFCEASLNGVPLFTDGQATCPSCDEVVAMDPTDPLHTVLPLEERFFTDAACPGCGECLNGALFVDELAIVCPHCGARIDFEEE